MPLTIQEEIELLALLEAEDEAERAEQMAREAGGWEEERARCAQDIEYWFDRWVYTFDPRLVGRKDERGQSISPFIPFKLYPRQREALRWLGERVDFQEEGLWEKSRDTGATYVCGGFALHKWQFAEGFKATFGSRKVDYVDKTDNPDAIFPKLRIMLYRQPPQLMPPGFTPARNDNYMRLYNPATGAIIAGEGGEDMGRGGRSTMYVVDEAAFVANAETVEKALSGNTDCVIWVSTVNGMGNLFARKRHSILKPRQIFRMHWRDDPRKTEEWAAAKKASLSDESAWASEYEIDYSASVEGIFIPAKWVAASQQLRHLIDVQPAPNGVAGLDVGGGKAKSVYVARFGPLVETPVGWGEPDTIETAHRALDEADRLGTPRSDGFPTKVRQLLFDTIGIGQGVEAALARAGRPDLITRGINVGDTPSDMMWPNGETSQERFTNLKGEAWSIGRERFKRTYELVQFLTGQDGGVEHPVGECISLPDDKSQHTSQLVVELSLPKRLRNEKGKIICESKDQLKKRGIASPDYAEALILTFTEWQDLSVWEKLAG